MEKEMKINLNMLSWLMEIQDANLKSTQQSIFPPNQVNYMNPILSFHSIEGYNIN